ncbi:hypothetical protein H8959_007003 [Pygathrix nigripes]
MSEVIAVSWVTVAGEDPKCTQQQQNRGMTLLWGPLSSAHSRQLCPDPQVPVGMRGGPGLCCQSRQSQSTQQVGSQQRAKAMISFLYKGMIMHFKNTPYCFDQLRRRFGDVFSLQLVWTPVVVLNGLAAVREALVTCGEDTADRPPLPIYQVLGIGPRFPGKRRWGTDTSFPWALSGR